MTRTRCCPMSLFLSAAERRSISDAGNHPTAAGLVAALRERVIRRTCTPGLLDRHVTVDWWHCVAELLTDAAALVALDADPAAVRWLREAAMAVARQDETAWIGPPFRNHSLRPAAGNLETAHLSWGLAVTLDLAPGIFSSAETDEIHDALRNHAIPLCQRWLEQNSIVSNWRCVLTAGLAVPAAVLNDTAAMDAAVSHYRTSAQLFQEDGSYGESLQYANYAALHLMLAWEALVRRRPELSEGLPLLPHGRFVNWAACSHFHQKPMGGGWGPEDRPRAANFGDSAAIFRPSADLLLHIANRTAKLEPPTAGVARWLFDTLYLGGLRTGPWDRASFGFVNHFGFLSLPLLTGAAPALPPATAGLTEVATFSNGDVLVRDSWRGDTILALRTGGTGPLACCGHLHGDLNSFILVHRRERLLVDPGHSCYRGLIHELETGSRCHNTCTFLDDTEGHGLQEETQSRRQQLAPMRRKLNDRRQLLPPVTRGSRTLLSVRSGEVTAVVSEAASAYGPCVREFTRVWLLAGSNALFVVDYIVTEKPMRTTWHWMFNNRDGGLDLNSTTPCQVTARRGDVGLQLLHSGPARLAGTAHAFIHDAYHPRPTQLGEGASGSGTLVQFSETLAANERRAVHGFVFAETCALPQCAINSEGDIFRVRDLRTEWNLEPGDTPRSLRLKNTLGQNWTIAGVTDGSWTLC